MSLDQWIVACTVADIVKNVWYFVYYVSVLCLTLYTVDKMLHELLLFITITAVSVHLIMSVGTSTLLSIYIPLSVSHLQSLVLSQQSLDGLQVLVLVLWVQHSLLLSHPALQLVHVVIKLMNLPCRLQILLNMDHYRYEWLVLTSRPAQCTGDSVVPVVLSKYCCWGHPTACWEHRLSSWPDCPAAALGRAAVLRSACSDPDQTPLTPEPPASSEGPKDENKRNEKWKRMRKEKLLFF